MIQEPEITHVDSQGAAETNAAAWMRLWGFHDAQVTDGGNNAGIDVWSTAALGQVKFEATQVGAPAVQKFVDAAGRDERKQLLFFSGSGYSQQALTYADTMRVSLFRYNLLGEMTSVNDAAHFITETPPPAPVDLHRSPPAPSPTSTQGRIAGRQADEDPHARALLNAVVSFPRDLVREWAKLTYQRSQSQSAPGKEGWWRRNWQFFVAGMLVTSSFGNLDPNTSSTAPEPNVGVALLTLVSAAAFGYWGYRKRTKDEVWRLNRQAIELRVQELPSEVAVVLQNLPIVVSQGRPASVPEYERVRAELDSFIEEGEFVSDSLVWAFYVRTRSAGSLREWIDSRPARLAQIPRGW